MFVEIVRTKKTAEKVDIDLPYFYRHDLMLDHGDIVYYGRIEEKERMAICVSCVGDKYAVEIERKPTNWQ